jgi:HSP20 family protein
MNNNNDYNVFPFDVLFNRFFNLGGFRKRGSLLDTTPLLSDIDDMYKEMNRIFNMINEISLTNDPKETIREYENQEDNSKLRNAGTIVYRYSMTIGPDGKPHVREFGNVKASGSGSAKNIGQYVGAKPQISAEREPLSDLTTTDKEVKVVLEIPGIKKEDIKVNAYNEKVEIKTAENAQRKYHKVIDLPKQADIETARSTYNNGILEVTFDKMEENKPKGKEIKIE